MLFTHCSVRPKSASSSGVASAALSHWIWKARSGSNGMARRRSAEVTCTGWFGAPDFNQRGETWGYSWIRLFGEIMNFPNNFTTMGRGLFFLKISCSSYFWMIYTKIFCGDDLGIRWDAGCWHTIGISLQTTEVGMHQDIQPTHDFGFVRKFWGIPRSGNIFGEHSDQPWNCGGLLFDGVETWSSCCCKYR